MDLNNRLWSQLLPAQFSIDVYPVGYITWKACARPSPTPAAEADLPDAGLHQQAILNFMLFFFLGGGVAWKLSFTIKGSPMHAGTDI